MKEIGEILKSKREEKKYSLNYVNAQTHIPLNYISAIEEGSFEVFPAEVYYLGSLRRYAKFLELNDEDLIGIYRRKVMESTYIERSISREAALKPSKAFYGVLLSTILIFFIGIFIWIGQEISVPSIKSRFLLLFDSGKTKISVTKSDSVKEAVEKSDILTLRIQSIHDTWIRVTADEKMVYEGTLLKGTEQEWKGKEKFYLSIGYVPGIKAILNGNPIDISVGAKRDINVLEITKDSLNSLKFSETNR